MRRPLAVICLLWSAAAFAQTIAVGSKKFTESYVLGEIAKAALERAGFAVEHRQGIGATSIVWQALTSGAIAAYAEYTGTISEELLKSKTPLSAADMRAELGKLGIGMTRELGFNNTYALAMRADQAKRLGIEKISDLISHPQLTVKLSQEFLARRDGWPNLSARYGLKFEVVDGIDHGIAYEVLRDGQIDVTDAYTTDAKIGLYKLVVLRDDLEFFPKYKAVFLYRLGTPAKAVQALEELAGTIDERLMISLNAEAERPPSDFARAAALYFKLRGQTGVPQAREDVAGNVLRWTGQHLKMVGLSMLLAVLVGVPLGIAAARRGPASQLILGFAGIVQTIPSLALLALLAAIPMLGIGFWTPIVALFLYSLLPIIRNTATGLQDIPPGIRESAAAIGLEPAAQMRKVYLPMAARSILAGIKTSTIINVGTATLAALVAQGGLGEPIISGLAVNDSSRILMGAVPAALLAILAQFAFDILDLLFIPRGLRLRPRSR